MTALATITPLHPERVSADVAEQEFVRWLQAMRLRVDLDRFDEDDRRTLEEHKHTVVTAIREGRLEIDDKGQAVFRPEEGDAITFYRPRGDMLAAGDKRPTGHNMEKSYQMLGALTKQPPVRYNNMFVTDLNVPAALLALFLGLK